MRVHEAYENVQRIICNGFLTVGIVIDGVEIVFKNISNSEFDWMQFYAVGGHDNAAEILSELALSTFIVSGRNMLENREENLETLANFYTRLPSQYISKLVSLIQELNRVYLESIKYLEGYTYTETSRNLWNSVGVAGFYREVSGIRGVESTGINQAQQAWMMINRYLDDELQYNKDFNLSIMIASSFNSKGARTVQRAYEVKYKEMIELREEISKYGYDRKRVDESAKTNKWTAPVKSRDDLVRELYRQMRGERDLHDMFVEKWIERQKAAAQRAKKQAEERQKQFRKELEDIDLSQLESSRPVTLEEIQKVRQRKNDTTKAHMSSYENIGMRDRYIKKISSRIIRGGAVQKR